MLDPRINPEDAKFVDSIIADSALFSIPFGVTFHRENVDSALDLCLVDSNDTVVESWKSDVPFSDGHDIITARIKCSLTYIRSYLTSRSVILNRLTGMNSVSSLVHVIGLSLALRLLWTPTWHVCTGILTRLCHHVSL